MLISPSVWREIVSFVVGLGADPQFFSSLALRDDCSRFLELLLAKNEEVNLTAVRDSDTAIWKHLADSLALLAFEPLGSVVDWGSGGGLPGIPLALARRSMGSPERVVFLDSVGKKVRAVESFCDALGLSQCIGFHGRGEALLQQKALGTIDTVVMRAVAPAERAADWISSSTKNWIFFLGPQQLEEWQTREKFLAKRGMIFTESKSFSLPHNFGERVLLKISKRST